MTQPFTFMFSEKQLAIIEHALEYVLDEVINDSDVAEFFSSRHIHGEDIAELQAAVCARLAW